MRTTFWLLLLFTVFALASCDKDDDSFNRGKNNPKFGETEVVSITSLDIGDCEPTVVDLIAGQHTKVGTVKVENDDDFLTVTYKIDGTAWCITETHLHIGMTAEDFPFAGRTSNVAPGRFDFSGEHNCELEVVYTIPKDELPDLQDGYFYIAAHAVVLGQATNGEVDLDEFKSKLPDEISLKIGTFPGSATVAYFEDVLISGGSFLDGNYDGWCVESTLGINSNYNYVAKVYSSYDQSLPSDIVDQPENLGKLNWLLNQDFVGKDAGGGLGIYTFRDLQVVIWKLIAFYPTNISPDGVGTNFSQQRVDKLLELVSDKGDFVPGCGKLIVLILEIENAQNIVITFPIPCYGDEETAWGAGTRFTERGNWAMYFKHKWMICD
jgi:hypothetical protein